MVPMKRQRNAYSDYVHRTVYMVMDFDDCAYTDAGHFVNKLTLEYLSRKISWKGRIVTKCPSKLNWKIF